ncbi:glycosyltransferase [Flavobacterium sp. ov086]|uniref:glycosyltransferase family 2 protein n=1 Tax=Flavobacterium sp. ov086 TaxID=1761785 RepID=UPI000B62F5E4|nr:glycosyltransferase [Flavobacterium sp. ov086]SNR49307.1 Glycosyltransferase involved in cell wall bisynthesis [Flavobacterium sp. ov086]
MSDLISIIIPTYNRGQLIRETLDSILMQTYKNWECIVVDDGSTDDTADILAKYIERDNRFQYHQRPEERLKGPNSCRNYGFELSKGEYVKWFDSDDLLTLNAFEGSSMFFSKLPDLIVSSLEFIDFNKNKIEKKHFFLSENIIQDYLTGKIKFYTFTPTWKKSFLKNQPYLFDEAITNMDDWDFNLRMLYLEPSIIYIDQPLIQYRIHENSLSQEISKLNFHEIQSEFKAIRKHLSLIEQNQKANPQVLKVHFKNRLKFIFRAALVENNEHKFFYLKQLLILELQLFQFLEIIKTIVGFTFYSLFKKGYKFLS